MPNSREDWPPEVLDAAALFTCGDVVEDPPYFYVANPAHAVMELTKRYDDGNSSTSEIVDASDIASPFGVITSQTCDIGEIDFPRPSKPFLAVSPVFDGTGILDAQTLSLLKKGRQVQAFLHLPALSEIRPGVWIADFRIELPVEKSWLVGRTPIKGFDSEEEARRVPIAVAEVRKRPAWSEDVTDAVGRVLDLELRDVKKSNRDLYVALVSEIREVGARSDSMLEPSWVQLAAFHEGDISQESEAWWIAVVDKIRTELGARSIGMHDPQILDLNECPVTTHRSFAPVGLGRHSPL